MAEKIDIEASKNEDFNKQKLSDLNNRLKKIHLGGGEKRSARDTPQKLSTSVNAGPRAPQSH